jgi:hypothetical protein
VKAILRHNLVGESGFRLVYVTREHYRGRH